MTHSLLPLETWIVRAKQHQDRVSPLADAFIKRRELGLTHAVHDFLFTYYSCSPLKLKQWVPSFEEGLVMDAQIRNEFPWLTDYWFRLDAGMLSLNRERLHENMRGQAQFILDLCKNVLQRPSRFGCYGLHEWAMVYRMSSEELRHNKHRLRLSPDELASFVESQTLCCSHYDAYRFFTPLARPMNTLNPTLETRPQMEQGGCVHANMDLYKWATKLWPWVGSDFIAKVFSLAVEARELDMRASPYDLIDEGYLPIRIETEEGRVCYQQEQQWLAERAAPLRQELADFCVRLLRA